MKVLNIQDTVVNKSVLCKSRDRTLFKDIVLKCYFVILIYIKEMFKGNMLQTKGHVVQFLGTRTQTVRTP